MTKEIITTGKTVEEALQAAAVELGADVAAIQYTVLEEPKRGLFGLGSVLAKISASYTMTGADIALDFIKTVIADMGLQATATMTDGDNDDKLINIDGEGSGVLIGHHGETLDSLQYLANLAANKKVDGEKREHVKITLDAEGYRAKREETLRALARRMAAKALRNNRSVMLEPMSAYERRIIHSEVQNIEGVSTNSIGSDNNRKIVIYLTNKKPQELFDKEESAQAIAGIAEEKGTEASSLENVTLDDGETIACADAIDLRETTEICNKCETCENADLCPTSDKEEDEAAPEDLDQDNA